MAYPPDHGIATNGALRLVLFLVGVSLVGYTVGPPLYWRFKGNSTGQASCPSCVCECSNKLISVLGIKSSTCYTNWLLGKLECFSYPVDVAYLLP
jgi:hypothetical protein